VTIQTTFAHGINQFTGLGVLPTTQPKPTMQTPAKPAKSKRTDEDYEVKDRYMTMRLPADVERELRKMAEANTRTLAAQILHYVKQGLAKEVKAVERSK
jgi:hypothetical protein